MSSGIYAIEHIASGRRYIGSAVELHKRFREHRTTLRRGKHYNAYLQRAWKKYGESAFRFTVIERVPDLKKLISREQYWIDKTKAHRIQYGFNATPKAGSQLGYRHTAETRRKLSSIHSGRMLDEEHRRAISESSKGKVHSNTARAKLSEANAALTKKQYFRAMSDYYLRGESLKFLAARHRIAEASMGRALGGKAYRAWQQEWLNTNGLKKPPATVRGNSSLTKKQVFAVLDNRRAGATMAKLVALSGEDHRKLVNIIKGKNHKAIYGEWLALRKPAKREIEKMQSHYGRKLGARDVQNIKRLLAKGTKQRDIASQYSVSPATICDIKHGRYH